MLNMPYRSHYNNDSVDTFAGPSGMFRSGALLNKSGDID